MQKCGGCTLCCKLLETHDVPSPIGIYCKYCEPGVGCKIHDARPKECSTYQCMWSQMPYGVGLDVRPDKIGIIFDKASERAIVATQDPETELTLFGLNQINAFKKQGYSVLLVTGPKRKLFLSFGHDAKEIVGDINDRSKLYRRSN